MKYVTAGNGADLAHQCHVRMHLQNKAGDLRRERAGESSPNDIGFVRAGHHYPEGWQAYSYAALCGISEHAMLWMLEQNPQLQKIALCLDSDKAGQKALERLTEILREQGYTNVTPMLPETKDRNDEPVAQQSGASEQSVSMRMYR